MNAKCSHRCCAYQALETTFQSHAELPKMFWLVRAVHPGVLAPNAARVAMRSGAACACT
ncbi:hypothetical protein D3C86_1992570 [compost metagenome]